MTAYMAYIIASAAGFDERMLELTRMASLSHDIGFVTMENPQSVEELERDAEKIAEIGAKHNKCENERAGTTGRLSLFTLFGGVRT